MSWSSGKTEKHCANCSYWGGRRNLRGSTVEVESKDLRGECFKGKAPSSNGASACFSCSQFDLWAAVKK